MKHTLPAGREAIKMIRRQKKHRADARLPDTGAVDLSVS